MFTGVTMKFNAEKPYNDLAFIPPIIELETKEILKQALKSHKILAELKGFAEMLPEKNIIINSIILQEAKGSSEIENIVTTHDELYRELSVHKKNINPAIKEVLAYRSALYKGFEEIIKNKLLTTNTIIAIQQELEQNNAVIRRLPGTKLMNDKTGEILYTPPDNESTIHSLLTNLEIFINEDDEIDPLIKLAIIHYQFESIHPFYDGNGRTGRIINVLYLVLQDLLNEPILYLSRYIIKHKVDYYRFLREVTTDENWHQWILFMLKAIEETSFQTLKMCKDISSLIDKVTNKVKSKLPKIYSKELIETIFKNVYTKTIHLVNAEIASRNIAAKYLKNLESIGILKSIKEGREMIYINIPLFNLLKEN